MPDPWRDKYPTLSGTFFRGGMIGQIRSVYKAADDFPEKIADFKRAIEAGDVKLDAARIPKPEQVKLTKLGINLPEVVTHANPPAASSVDEPEDTAAAEPSEIVL